MITMGAPGTGKSQALLAFLWFAFQHGASDLIAICSYTWRAATNISTPTHTGVSTCRLFGISPINNTYATTPDLQLTFRKLRFLLVDEFSFLSCPHFLAMSESAAAALKVEAVSEAVGRARARVQAGSGAT